MIDKLPQFIWVEAVGRDREGDAVNILYLVDATDRVLAGIDLPQLDEKTYRCDLYGGDWERYYMSLESAKKYCEERAELRLAGELKCERARKRARKKKWPNAGLAPDSIPGS